MKKFKKLAQVVASTLFVTMMFSTSAFAMNVPISQTEQMIDGRQTLVKVFEVDAATAPESLVEENLEQNGYRYYMTSIVKDAVMVEDEQEITQDYEVTVAVSDENNARLEALKSMPAFIEYDEDGYVGKLYPIISSLEGEVTGRTTHSGKKTMQKSYTYDYNDDSLVPASANGYSLSTITWSDGGYISDTAIPSSYTATATYTKPYSYSTVDGWKFTMTYSGDVEYEHEDVVRYTITYTGEEIGFFDRLFGNHSEGATAGKTPSSGSHSVLGTLLGVLCVVLAAGALGFGVYTLVMFVRNGRVIIYARDEMTGEFSEMDKVWFKKKEAVVKIDTLAAPATRYFRVLFKPALAEDMKGKVVTIQAGQKVLKHQIGEASGTDYIIDVNIDSIM